MGIVPSRPRPMRTRHVVLQTPSESSDLRQLLSSQQSAPISPLSATLTKNRGVGGPPFDVSTFRCAFCIQARRLGLRREGTKVPGAGDVFVGRSDTPRQEISAPALHFSYNPPGCG